VFFGYTQDKEYNINDIYFLIPEDKISLVLKTLEEKEIEISLAEGWDCIQIFRDDLKVELDPLRYYGILENLEEMKFGVFVSKMISNNDLTNCYKNVFQDNHLDEVGLTKRIE